jgi:hypothetical protein
VCIDCERHGLALAAIEQTMLRVHFADAVYFTDRALPIEEFRVVPIGPCGPAQNGWTSLRIAWRRICARSTHC